MNDHSDNQGSPDELELAQLAHRSGLSKDAYLELRVREVQKAALLGAWSPQVLASTLSNVRRIIDRVYNPDTVWTKRKVTVTRGALAVLEELRVGDAWDTPAERLPSGELVIEIEDDTYQKLCTLQRDGQSLSDVILEMYRNQGR